jgi:hypothetical protein
MNFTEIMLDASELKLIVDSLKEFAIERSITLRNVQFLSPEQRASKEKGEKIRELADGLSRLSSETAFYVVNRIES